MNYQTAILNALANGPMTSTQLGRKAGVLGTCLSLDAFRIDLMDLVRLGKVSRVGTVPCGMGEAYLFGVS